jgi:hypothetical protein
MNLKNEESLLVRAERHDQAEQSQTMTKVAGAMVGFGLIVSAILTIIYLTLLVYEAVAIPGYGLGLGILVGVVAVIPAELALLIWRERLAGERTITGLQRATAVSALLLAGIFSALTTASFFSYFLPQLFPAAYISVAPSLNVAAIVGSWIVFIMAISIYSISSRQTKQNLEEAKVLQKLFDARMGVLRGFGQAMVDKTQETVNDMERRGVFQRDALQLIGRALDMENSRLGLDEGDQVVIDQAPDQTPTANGPIQEGPVRPTRRPTPMPNGRNEPYRE